MIAAFKLEKFEQLSLTQKMRFQQCCPDVAFGQPVIWPIPVGGADWMMMSDPRITAEACQQMEQVALDVGWTIPEDATWFEQIPSSWYPQGEEAPEDG
ncbi:hypothetical protein [Deinococcus cellulosilyticus]|uniref:Uncharacterized protein n=1 Tax=Deinococcus cellulosilyticus (strain DSM 18568 / NBRC 106333 / KACC 11606 / 5516J-15) TaxID=1223518 RepID=A0A511N3Y5_DEIC1|nr:hypothetical protein [Deinococcus cellulosilyticus]GEM47207.1 hypothetical protein DC3_28420 [Deinococcus cellulosilyticus NBRC 106333 = KACC 11606]